MLVTSRGAKLLARLAPWLVVLGVVPVAQAQQPSSTGASSAALATIAPRVRVETGDDVAIGGFVIAGNAPKRVMVRAVGPTLADLLAERRRSARRFNDCVGLDRLPEIREPIPRWASPSGHGAN